MKYKVVRNQRYDFTGQSYGVNSFPNLHQYPATMIPQIGIEALDELDVSSGSMLDPYCGSGSSFASGLACGIKDFTGFDLNPLAITITKVRFSKINLNLLQDTIIEIRKKAYNSIIKGLDSIEIEKFNNFDYWFSKHVASNLQLLKNLVSTLDDCKIRDFLLLALSSTIRDCSYVRNNEFKLYRMKEESLLTFNPDVLSVFFDALNKMVAIYKEHYHNNLGGISLNFKNKPFKKQSKLYNIVLASPPYGDSRTTVAYGQFSMFANSWALGVENARAVDKTLMGGTATKQTNIGSIIDDQIKDVNKENSKRALEVASFYKDLRSSIADVSQSIEKNGYSIYVVGNRTVKGVNLRTDQFIAEQFEKNGLKHLITYERAISNKRMPKLNSPTNQPGKKVSTMNNEFVVICQN